MELEKGKVHAPEIGTEWVNSAPLTLASLRGRVVLVDFWDYTCVNCIRTLPYVVEWHRRYHDKGLTVIGVHAPEFSFARTKELVAAAIVRFGIEYAVAMDNGYMIWQAFANKCWPAKYLIDKDGYMRFFHLGEGDYAGTEEAIRTLLREINPALGFGPLMEPLRDTDRAGAVCYRATPELYLGNRRGRIGNASGFQKKDEAEAVSYAVPSKLDADIFYLRGPWRSGPESVISVASGGDAASVLVYYVAKEVNLVMAPGAAGSQSVELLHDGKPLAREDAGEDVPYTPSGESVVPVDTPRMYNLARNREMGQHVLQLVARAPDLECFAFTFVSCAAPCG